MSILVTGGAGFIGANFVLDRLAQCDESLTNLDALTYAGNLKNLASLAQVIDTFGSGRRPRDGVGAPARCRPWL